MNGSPESGVASSVGLPSLRAQHHAVTRQVILQAARDLFAELGFAQTSVKAISQRAGVAIQTIYSTFGSKAGLVTALVDLIDDEVGVAEATRELEQLDDPAQQLRVIARLQRQFRERSGDLLRAFRSGAAVDPDVAAVLAEGHRRRYAGLDRLTAVLGANLALKDGLDPRRAADIAAALMADDPYEVLVEHRGWSFDEYERWLADTLVELLLR